MFIRREIPIVTAGASRSESKRPSATRRRRAAFGSMIALALGSPFVWSAPASAVPVDIVDGELCTELFGVYWLIEDFIDDGLTTTYDEGEQTVTFLSTIDLTVLDIEDYEPRIEFYGDAQCVGTVLEVEGDPDADSLPPENFKMCVTATPGSVTSFDLEFRKFPSVEYGLYLISDAVQDFVYDLAGLTGGTYEDVDPSDAVVIPELDPAWVPSRIVVENLALDPSFTGTLEVQIVLAVDPVCGLGGETPGGNYDIDWEYYRNRAAAGATALPNTL